MKIIKGGKELRTGYTTGSCAAAAAAAATEMLFTGSEALSSSLTLPSGDTITLDIVNTQAEEGKASCAVIKDAGDDPDVTDGLYIYAECSLIANAGVEIRGGSGVGVVTEDGLPIAKGLAAINPVPRAMIEAAVAAICHKHSHSGGVQVTISVPRGEEVAKRTFNPQLGIVGGISILGSTGIVEPMSEKAIVDTIKLIMDKRRSESDALIITLGNYGLSYCTKAGLDMQAAVKGANFIGESLDYAAYKGFKKLTLVGHVGKLVKLAAGIMNTHSNMADGRMEILCAHAALAGANNNQLIELLACVTTSAAIEKLDSWALTDAVFASVMDKIAFHVSKRLAQAAGSSAKPAGSDMAPHGEIILFAQPAGLNVGERTLAIGQI